MEFVHENVLLDMSKQKPLPIPISTLTPSLRTAMAPARKPTQRDAIIGLEKRNLNVPQLEELIDTDYMIEVCTGLFLKTYVDDSMLPYFEAFPQEQIHISQGLVAEWLYDQPDSVLRQITEVLDLATRDLSRYSLMNKRTVKPGLDMKTPHEYAAVQTIASQSKSINAIFCPVFHEMKSRLLAVLKPNFMMFCDCSPDEFAERMNTRFRPLEMERVYKKLEVDIGKYDKSQNQLLFEVECRLYASLGMSQPLLDLWRLAHESTTLVDYEWRAGACQVSTEKW